ncbi:type II toxin-antitoxin system RelE/ParE family toxin [Pseudorhodoferax sp. Leaf267]|uniref:type II toxin-antitoxin system RelE/ParE family toxin n=1 Tax=Pseudorhodoferax sp. Leaf267 TaxID=1736316 RepID=UPI0006FEDD4D|nr:type II toxin-antitoxin system RelE/ParE family toxin [Pseudorhodoferax sp. Leaf267]KQP12676.1 plasmid stabilization protein [Pseudorhodoferax sp. Leaf267]
MTQKPVILRAQARQDVYDAIDWYLEQQANTAASGFVDALERAYRHIARQPTTGSPRYAHELGLPGVRFWPLTRYPHLVFYIERDDHIDVWRVLHGQRDIPVWMLEPSDPP